MILDHTLPARRPKTISLLAGVWGALLLVWQLLDAALWILIPIGGFTLPAIYEAARGDVSRLTVDADRITWTSPRHRGDAPVRDIDHVRFDTRIDFAINARLTLINGAVVRLPIECVPPYAKFCDALDRAGIRHERHHFRLF